MKPDWNSIIIGTVIGIIAIASMRTNWAALLGGVVVACLMLRRSN